MAVNGDLRTRVEALLAEWRDTINVHPDATMLLEQLSRVLDADPDTPTAEPCGAPAGTCPHGVCRKTMSDPYGCGGCCACLGGCQEQEHTPTADAPATCNSGVGGGETCALPRGHSGPHDPDAPISNRTVASVTDHDATPTGPAMIPPTADAPGWHEHRGDPVYCNNNCRPGVKHSQCGCRGDHRLDMPTADARAVVTRDGFETEFNAQSDAEAKAYKAGWGDALSEIRDEDALRGWGGEGADTPTADAPADTDPGDYVEAWFRLTLNHPDTKAAAFVAMHVSRLVQERDELRAQVEAALNQAADALEHEQSPGDDTALHFPSLLREMHVATTTANWLRDRAARGETRQPADTDAGGEQRARPGTDREATR